MNHRLMLSLAISALLTSCGGGGSASSGPSTVPVAVVFERLLAQGGTFSASTSSGAQNLSLTIQPTADARFNSSLPVSKVTLLNAAVRQGGTVVATDQQAVYFTLAPVTFLAVQGRVIQSSGTLPASAPLAATGRAYSSPGVGRGLFSTPPLEGTWSVDAGADGRTFLCLTNRLGYGLLSSPSFETTTIANYCFSIDTSGQVNGFKASTSTDRRSTIANPVVDTVNYDS